MLAMVGAISVPLGLYLERPGIEIADLFALDEWTTLGLLGYAWRGVLFLAFVSLHITLATIATIYGFRLIMLLGRWVSTAKKP